MRRMIKRFLLRLEYLWILRGDSAKWWPLDEQLRYVESARRAYIWEFFMGEGHDNRTKDVS